eukprot:3158724-Amphidinium_carterae.1
MGLSSGSIFWAFFLTPWWAESLPCPQEQNFILVQVRVRIRSVSTVNVTGACLTGHREKIR